MPRTRVALADDDVLLRAGLASLLEQAGYEIVGQAGDATELLALVRGHEPDLVIVDIRMPPDHETEGLDAARVIRAEHPQIGILVLSAHVVVEEAMELLASGVRTGYLLKTRVTDVTHFLESLDRIAEGGSVVDPGLVQELVRARRKDDPLAELTPREREVLELMAEGRSNAGIGRRLWVTDRTVEKHVHSILLKLQLPEADDDHRRVLAALAFLEATLALEHGADTLGGQGRLGQEPDRGAVRDHVREVPLLIRRDEDDRAASRLPDSASRSARSNPLSSPRSMSTRQTSGRNERASCVASSIVDATPTTSMPWPSNSSRAAVRNRELSSTRSERIQAQNGTVGLLATSAPAPRSIRALTRPQVGRYPRRQARREPGSFLSLR